MNPNTFNLSWLLQMAWRDSRRNRARLALFISSIILGIAALVGIGSFADNLQHTVATQTKSLVGADLTLTSRQPFSAAAQSAFRAVGGGRADDVGLNTMIDFPGPDHRRRLVQVRAISGAFPFYGDLVTEPAGAMAALSTGRSALLEETLMIQFGVQAGDTVSIGGTPFTVAGALRKIPGESAAVATSCGMQLAPGARQRGFRRMEGFERRIAGARVAEPQNLAHGFQSSSVTVPAAPSTRMRAPSRMVAVPTIVPATQGMRYSRATMAQCESGPPESATTAPA